MKDLARVFCWICDQDTNYGCLHVFVYPATWCARCTGIPLRRVRDAMRRLAKYGYIQRDHEGGWNDYACCIYCVHGYATTEKGRSTAIWKKFEREEIKLIEEMLNHDTERDETISDAVP